MRAVAALLFLLLVAGCVRPVEPDLAESDAPRPKNLRVENATVTPPLDAPPTAFAPNWTAIGASLFSDHDHTDRALHREEAHGLRVKASSSLSVDGRSLGEYGELDHARGLVAVAISNSTYAGKFALLDAAALPEIRLLSLTEDPQAYGDVKLDREQPLLYNAHALNLAFTIWDVSDPSRPQRIGEARGAGCHMMAPMSISGVSYVWCGTIPSVLYRIDRLPDGRAVATAVGSPLPQHDPEIARYAEYYRDITPAGPALIATPHDANALFDPFEPERPLLVAAYELNGVRVFDLTIPQAPVEIAYWRGEGLDRPMERVHTAVMAKVGERRLVLAATETWTHAPPEWYLVDFTDFAAPRLLSVLRPPGIPEDGGLLYSAHNPQLVDSRAYLANFHGGVWVFDLADPTRPTPIAVRSAVRDAHYPEPGYRIAGLIPGDVNMFWDVVVANGYAIASDMSAGIEVFAVEGDPLGDPKHASAS